MCKSEASLLTAQTSDAGSTGLFELSGEEDDKLADDMQGNANHLA
jgi:hypothetical protein